jgi:hypothetical protein
MEDGDRTTKQDGPQEVEAGRQRRVKHRYKGGRQTQGGIPNPDDADDRDSAGSFRGTGERDVSRSR